MAETGVLAFTNELIRPVYLSVTTVMLIVIQTTAGHPFTSGVFLSALARPA